jgi:hypothetical protein
MYCSICNAKMQQWALGCWGNNADPLPGRCCDDCNRMYVLPARIELIRQGKFLTISPEIKPN